MKQTAIHDMVGIRLRKMIVAFEKVMESFEAEAIHDFRVEVKKLRAFLRLIRTTSDGPHAGKLPRRLHKFYAAIGHVRSLQMQEQGIRAELADIDKSFPEQYLQMLEGEKAAFILLARKIAKDRASFKGGLKKLETTLPRKLNSKMIRGFVASETQNIEQLLRPVSPEDDSMHLVRKSLKDLQYTWAYITGDMIAPVAWGPLIAKDDIKSMASRLGDFQDICSGLLLLDAGDLIQVADEEERSTLLHIEKKWRQKKEEIKPPLCALLKETFKR